MLYVVSTPIGNLKDISLRALEALKSSDAILCEDTRRSRILLSHYQIQKPLISYHSYNQIRKVDEIIKMLLKGKDLSLVSDSGTPAISDPGGVLVSKAIEAGIKVAPVPGANAAVTALSVSGFACQPAYFCGFLPVKQGRRQKALLKARNLEVTVVIYEAPHRLLKLLLEIKEVFGDRRICVCRELTKQFEEIRREKTVAAIEHFSKNKPKGEFVLVVE